MNDPVQTNEVPLLPLEPFLSAIGGLVRWRILQELVKGEPLMVVELAERLGKSASLVSKHMKVLRDAGAVTAGRAGLYRLPPQFPASAEERTVDFGYCVLRLGARR